MEIKSKVLVLDGDMVSSLTIARSLWKKGINVDLAGHVDGPVAASSRAVKRYLKYPDPLTNSDNFIEWLSALSQDESYDLIIPVTERSLTPISLQRAHFTHCRMAMADQTSLDAVLDKSKTFDLARKLGLGVPIGYGISALEDLEKIKTLLKYPVVVKPARSVGLLDNERSQLKVEYAFNDNELLAKLRHALRYGEVILQEYVAGEGVGVEVLAYKGDVVYAFQHLRLHEVPLTGGGSSLRRSVPLQNDLLEAAKKLIKALNWHGVAMVEFKNNPQTGKNYLMEINGRFWGSLPLAAAAGADFPGMLFDLLVKGKTEFNQHYNEDVYCRRLTSDVHWYELALRKAAPKELGVLPTKGRMLKDFLLMFSFKHRFDVQSFIDPIPGLLEVKELIASYWHRFKGIAKDKQFYAQQKKSWKHGLVANKAVGAKHALFVCYGNINRSALAEHYVKSLGLKSGLEISSAGFHQQQERPADPIMQKVALVQGLDISASSSRCLTQNMVEVADVIFVMDKSHYERIAAICPQAVGHTFLLGANAASGCSNGVIDDPYGRPRKDYEYCYAEVIKGVDEFVKLTSNSL